ncbi:MAG: hypothetical protein KQH57_05220 [Actinomycetales bacterium]|nr:hypothetical protein [Actinomycetales bacterium]
MHSGPGPQTSARTGTRWTIALYIRDALGLPFSPDMPRLAPAIRQNANEEADPPVTESGWAEWLDRLVEGTPGSLLRPDHDPGLLTWYDRLELEARDWEGRAAQPGRYESSLVPRLLREAKSSGVQGMVHETEFVPVEGRWHLSLRPDLLLVSVATWNDAEEMDRILEPLIRSALGLSRPSSGD